MGEGLSLNERASARAAIRTLSDLVVLPHSVFALPFALASLMLGFHRGPSVPLAAQPVWIVAGVVICVVAARTSAMAFNRLVDADVDALNPRTQQREIPAGTVSKGAAVVLCASSATVFFLSSAFLGRHCLVASPFVLVILLGYSLTKRFTAAAHLVLGLALALAPGGAWWVLRPQVEPTPLLMMGGVLLWVSGFDILYSAQDVAFDREHGVFSIPAALGIESAFQLSRIFHGVSFALFAAVGISEALRWPYWLGVISAGGLLYAQHRVISPFDLTRINRAFFTCNGLISFLYLVGVWCGIR